MPSRQRSAIVAPGGLVARSDLLLEGLVLLVELGQAGLGPASAARPCGGRAASMASRISRCCVVWTSTIRVGVDLVDLAEPLVALGLGGGERLAIALLGPFQVFVAAGGDALALLFERARRPGRGSRRSGHRRRPALHERQYSGARAGLGELDQPGAQQERRARRPTTAAAPSRCVIVQPRSAKAEPDQRQDHEDEDPGFAPPFIALGMIRPSSSLSGGSIRASRVNSSSLGIAEPVVRLARRLRGLRD